MNSSSTKVGAKNVAASQKKVATSSVKPKAPKTPTKNKIIRKTSAKKIPVKVAKPTPTKNEIEITKDMVLTTKTDSKGNIIYANDDFLHVTGYSIKEVVCQPHNINRHPDMPKTVFKMMWDSIKDGNPFPGIIKNVAKNGDFYWVATNFHIEWDKSGTSSNFAETREYMAERKGVANPVKDIMSKLYANIKEAEEVGGVQAGEDFLYGFLSEKKMTYREFISSLHVDFNESLDDDNFIEKFKAKIRKFLDE